MSPPRARLQRLRRLEAIRAVAARTAMQSAAEAETALAQLQALAERTRRLATDYDAAAGTADGGALLMRLRFAAGLRTIHASASDDTARARIAADARMDALAAAERRRTAVTARADLEARRIASAGTTPQIGARRPRGTNLE